MSKAISVSLPIIGPNAAKLLLKVSRGGAAAIVADNLNKMVDAKANDSMTKDSRFRLVLLALMVVQNSSVVLIGRFTRSKNPDELYSIPHFVLVTELAKFVCSCCLEFYSTNGKLISSIKEFIIDRPIDCLQILVPSLLYLVQNSLLYVALSNLSAPLFQVTYQSKLLTTALVSVVLLQRRYNVKQWLCLFTLGIGVAIVVLSEKKAGPADVLNQSLTKGLLSVIVACLSSALAGVYLEMVLKGKSKTSSNLNKPSSLWMRNIQMSFFSMVIGIINLQFFVNKTSAKESDQVQKSFFHGFDNLVYFLVVLQAAGGLLVAAIIKYADNVMKGLATGIAVVTSTLLSTIIFKSPLTAHFVIGASIILTSVFIFSNSSTPHENKATGGDDVEMKRLVLPK